jgi:hypothetical protein
MNRRIDVSALRDFSGQQVRVLLDDGSDYAGTLRTELLTELSLAVYLDAGAGDGTTLYIEQIADIRPV